VAARAASGSTTAAASGALRTCKLTIALVANGGKEFLDLLAVARGTNDFLFSKDQDLEILVAFGTVIFKNGHVVVSLIKMKSLSAPFLYGTV
jgi:hypothetical protein